MRAKDKLVSAIENTDPSKIKRKKPSKDQSVQRYGDAPKGWKDTGDWIPDDDNLAFKAQNPGTGVMEDVLGPEDIIAANTSNTPNADYSILKQYLSPPIEGTESEQFFKKAKNYAINNYQINANDYLIDAIDTYIANHPSEAIKPEMYKARKYILKGLTNTQRSLLLKQTDNIAQLLSLSKSELSKLIKSTSGWLK